MIVKVSFLNFSYFLGIYKKVLFLEEFDTYISDLDRLIEISKYYKAPNLTTLRLCKFSS